MNTLFLGTQLPVRANNGGLFVSRGEGTHPDRVIGSHELIFVREGLLELQEAQQTFKVGAGETLLLWPGRRHRGTAPYPADLSYFWLHFDVLQSQAGETFAIPQHATISRPDHLTTLFRRFLDDQESMNASPLSASLLVMLMLCEVAGSRPSATNSGNTAALLASRADALIRTRFHEPLSTSSLAKDLHSNPDYLGRTFRSAYGCSLTEAIHGRRIKHARKLLLESERTIDEVASACGFSDTGYFRRLFKRAEGMTPHQFRRLYAKLHINTE